MEFRRLIIAVQTLILLLFAVPSVSSMDISVGNIRVQMAPNGELFVDTPSRRIYIPSDDTYYEEGDYYEGDYDDYYEDEYYEGDCAGGSHVVQQTVQRSSGGNYESYSRVSSSCN